MATCLGDTAKTPKHGVGAEKKGDLREKDGEGKDTVIQSGLSFSVQQRLGCPPLLLLPPPFRSCTWTGLYYSIAHALTRAPKALARGFHARQCHAGWSLLCASHTEGRQRER